MELGDEGVANVLASPRKVLFTSIGKDKEIGSNCSHCSCRLWHFDTSNGVISSKEAHIVGEPSFAPIFRCYEKI